MRSSDDITSLVPCLAVKGTNLMISRVRAGQRGLENMANGLSACFFTVAFSSARIKAWRPGPSRSDRRQRALTDVSHQSSPGRANGWTPPQLLHT